MTSPTFDTPGGATTVLSRTPTLATVKFGALSAVSTGGLMHGVATGQLGSPPPLTLAVFVTLAPAAAVGVTLMVKTAVLPGATLDRPDGTLQVTTWPATAQPAGVPLMVRPFGIVSVTVAAADVGAAPALVTVTT